MGGKEKMSAIVEKQREPKIRPANMARGWINVVPTARETRIGMMEIARPVKAEASISPKRIVQTDTGHDASLSRVLA